MGWGDAWAGLSQQSFNTALNSLSRMQDNKQQIKRDEIARKAEEEQRRLREQYEQKKADNQILQTFTDPETGLMTPITAGQVRSGKAKVPQSVLQQQRAQDEALAQEQQLKTRRTEAQIAADEARAQASQASAGLATARAQNPERFMRPNQERAPQADPSIRAVRSTYNTLANKGDKTQQQIMAELESLYGTEAVDQAFPGQGARRQQAAQNVGRVVTGVDDLLDKYLKR